MRKTSKPLDISRKEATGNSSERQQGEIIDNIKSGRIGVIQYLKSRGEWHSPYIVGALAAALR
ncbi:MAG: hypothetical protein F6K39_15930 [Okeania sp. SIO3B3]|nr:hypothetical protein [Okeania sp. SIO3B3]